MLQVHADDAACQMQGQGPGVLREVLAILQLVCLCVRAKGYALLPVASGEQDHIAGILTVLNGQKALPLAVAHDAARVDARADGDIVGRFREICIVLRRDGQTILVIGSCDLTGNQVLVQARKQLTFLLFKGIPDCFARGEIKLGGRIGSLITHDAAHISVAGDASQDIVGLDAVHGAIRRQRHHIGADAAAHIIFTPDTGGLNGQLGGQKLLGSVQTESAARAVAVGVDTAADEGIVYVDVAGHIVEARDTAHVVLAHHDTGYGLDRDGLTFLRKRDLAVIVACDAARVAAGGLPGVDDHIENGAVIVGQVAGAVQNLRILLVVARDAADIAVITRYHAVVDTAFQDDVAVVLAYDAAHVAVTHHVAGVGGDCHAAVGPDGLGDISAQSSGDAAHVIGAQNIAVLLGGTVI